MRSWSFWGGPGTLPYRGFDRLRDAVNRSLVRYLLGCAVPRAGGRVLEAGSGPGHGTSLLSRDGRVSLAVAADLDLEALRQARRRDASLPAVVGDLRHLPFAPNTFDLVWNSSTIEHLDEPAAAVREMRRITKPGGHVFIGVPAAAGPLGFQRWIPATSVGVWIGRVFRTSELTKMTEDSGLTTVGLTRYCAHVFIGILTRRR